MGCCWYSCNRVEIKLVQAQPSLPCQNRTYSVYRSCQSMLLAALLLFSPNCTFHKFLNVWGTGMKSCAFWFLSLLFFLSLSLTLSPFWVEGKAGGRRGTDALVKGRRRKCSPLLQEMVVKLKHKQQKKYCHAKFFCCFHRCRTAGAIEEAWVWQQREFGLATEQIDICLPGLNNIPLRLLDKFWISIKLI